MNNEQIYEVREHHATQNDIDIHDQCTKLGIPFNREPIEWTDKVEEGMRAYLIQKKQFVIRALDGKGTSSTELVNQYYGDDLDPNNLFIKDELELVRKLLTTPSSAAVLLTNRPDPRCGICRIKSPGKSFAKHCPELYARNMEFRGIKDYVFQALNKLGYQFNVSIYDGEELIEVTMNMGDYREMLSKYWDIVEL